MTKLSVNLNRIALLRNSRDIGIPNVMKFAKLAVEAGAQGITVHPRPDQRHIRVTDVADLKAFLANKPQIEFNIEGNPFSTGPAAFMEIVRGALPDQVTLVPDSDAQATSDHGWDLVKEGAKDGERLRPIVAELKSLGCRVSLFMDPDPRAMAAVKALGADRAELYTKPYADAFNEGHADDVLEQYRACIAAGKKAGLAFNAGHDLNLLNLSGLLALGGIEEVSIGHALIADALELGFANAVKAYRALCDFA